MKPVIAFADSLKRKPFHLVKSGYPTLNMGERPGQWPDSREL